MDGDDHEERLRYPGSFQEREPSDLVMVGSRPREVSTPNRMMRMMPVETERDKEYLTLKVVRPSQEQDSVEIHFRVKRTTQMGKLKKSYSERQGVHVTSLRFLYDGRRISDDATPGTLEMESGDYIEVYNELGVGLHFNPSPEPSDGSHRTEVTGPLDTAQWESSLGETIETGLIDNQRRVSRYGDIAETGAGQSKRPRISLEPRDPGQGGGARAATQSQGIDLSNANNEVPAPNGELEAVRTELANVTKKYDDLVKKLRDKVECPVCFEVPKKAPIPVCPNGHVVCSRCVRDTCPTCRVRMEQAKSTLAVTVIENIEHTCDHEQCGQSMPLPELAHHLNRCLHRIVPCPGLWSIN